LAFGVHIENGGLFACVHGEGVGVKVPEEVANVLLSEKHGVSFQRIGKPKMREWIQIDRVGPEDYQEVINPFPYLGGVGEADTNHEKE
jgi:hypothetical protein